MKVILKHVLVMMLLAPRALVSGSLDELPFDLEATISSGLEADNTTQLQVLIEGLSEEAKNIGLTRERIEARVNQSLRKAGITPVNPNPAGPNEDYLYVNVNTSGSSFAILISFERLVFYRSGGKWFLKQGSTCRTGSTGTASGAAYILDHIAEQVEVFCNEFLKANGK